MERRVSLLIAGGLTSGVASASLGCFLLSSVLFMPGVLFAALVIIPWSRMLALPPREVWWNAALCVLGYVVAHFISSATSYIATPLGAAVGTGIMLTAAFTNPAPAIRRSARLALATGTLAAFVFAGFALVPEGWWGLLLGIVVWQVAVASALTSAFQPLDSRAEGLHVANCPHCGAGLPMVCDAFCSSCREPLDEAHR